MYSITNSKFFIVVPCVLIETTFTRYIDRRDSDDRVILYVRNNSNNNNMYRKVKVETSSKNVYIIYYNVYYGSASVFVLMTWHFKNR